MGEIYWKRMEISYLKMLFSCCLWEIKILWMKVRIDATEKFN